MQHSLGLDVPTFQIHNHEVLNISQSCSIFRFGGAFGSHNLLLAMKEQYQNVNIHVTVGKSDATFAASFCACCYF